MTLSFHPIIAHDDFGLLHELTFIVLIRHLQFQMVLLGI